MKKFASLILILVLCVSGAALACGPRHEQHNGDKNNFQPRQPGQPGHPQRPEFNRSCCGGAREMRQDMRHDHAPNFKPDFRPDSRPDFRPDFKPEIFGMNRPENLRGRFENMPPEIRSRAIDLAKWEIELEAVLSEHPIDRERALDIHAHILSLRNDIEMIKFSRFIDEKERLDHENERGISSPALEHHDEKEFNGDDISIMREPAPEQVKGEISEAIEELEQKAEKISEAENNNEKPVAKETAE